MNINSAVPLAHARSYEGGRVDSSVDCEIQDEDGHDVFRFESVGIHFHRRLTSAGFVRGRREEHVLLDPRDHRVEVVLTFEIAEQKRSRAAL